MRPSLSKNLMVGTLIVSLGTGLGTGAVSAQEINNNISKATPQKGKIVEKLPQKIEVNQPEVNQPEVKKPEVKKPEAKKPEVKKPEVKKPEVKKPEVKQPEAKKPEVKKPEVKQPEVKQPTKQQLAEAIYNKYYSEFQNMQVTANKEVDGVLAKAVSEVKSGEPSLYVMLKYQPVLEKIQADQDKKFNDKLNSMQRELSALHIETNYAEKMQKQYQTEKDKKKTEFINSFRKAI